VVPVKVETQPFDPLYKDFYRLSEQNGETLYSGGDIVLVIAWPKKIKKEEIASSACQNF
jgi:hypothetical protein